MRFTTGSRFGSLTRCAAIALACLTAATIMVAQTSSTGSIAGTVTDPTGAVVPRAMVNLVNPATNASTSVTTNDTGQYVFASLTPGTYRVSVTAQGFSTATVNDLAVQVNKSLNVPVQLAVGTPNETVEVQATAKLELQTTDAQIGNTLSSDSVARLPTLRRDAMELFTLQPGVAPTGSGNNTVRVTGAIEDQNTVTIDGIDVTENIVGTGGFNGAAIPLPAAAVEEFRVNVANPNATVNRSSGGQINLVGKRGTNSLHGYFDYYKQDDQLNANDWSNNHLGIKRPAITDNRYTAGASGPIWKNKTFFFGSYEGRRFQQAAQITRVVPTDSLKAGVLKFRDASGQVVSYDLKTSALCGPSDTLACDPRALGISPTVKNLWGQIAPGNDPTLGDGLNTTGYRGNVAAPLKADYYSFRLDHAFTQKYQFNGSYTYYRQIQTATGQVDIRSATPKSVISNPIRADLITGILTMNLRPNLLNVVRFGTIRNRNFNNAEAPSVVANQLALAGTNTAKDGPVALLAGFNVAGGGGMSPVDVDTQRARFQASLQRSTQFVDDATWIHGNHTVQFGASTNLLWLVHIRADKVVGSLTSLAATLDSGLFLTIPNTNRPRGCGSGVTTNCIQATDQSQWDRLYAASLGLVDNIGIMMVRDGSLNPLPFGTFLANDTLQKAWNFYGQDTWRMTPNFTLTYGVAYGWQAPPSEKLHRQTVEIDATTGKPLTAETYLNARLQAAQQGTIFNPLIGYAPVASAHLPVYNTDYGDWAPRVAAAWNPSAKSGFLGSILGDHKTVLRGGFSLVYDRTNTVQSVLIPMLGVGFAQNITLQKPGCNLSGSTASGCNPANSANPAASVFRIGVDGTVPVPVIPAVTNPVIPPPGTATSTGFTESLSFQVDPNVKVGRSYNADFSIQREIPGNMVLEAAYSGRFGRHLEEAVNLAQVPYMMKDNASGQTFAQAYDNIATALRAGTPASALPAQPFFENQFKGLNTGTSANATQFFASQFSSQFVTGLVSSLVQQMGIQRRKLGLQPFVNDQVLDQHMRTYLGQSNYNGLLVTLRNRGSHGVSYAVNYTWSHTLDWTVLNQNQATEFANSFFPGAEYGPSTFDRRHVVNGTLVYDLPFGTGKKFATGGFLDRIVGGWYVANIFSAWTGLPLTVTESGQAWGGGPQFANSSGMIPTAAISSGFNSGVTGSNGIGVGPKAGGTGFNLFSDPAGVFNSLRRILLSSDTRSGRGAAFRGLPYWNLDTSVGKSTHITERVSAKFTFDFFNVMNHVNFADPPGGNLTTQGNTANFGVISSAFIPANRASGARWIQFGAGVQF